MDGRHFAKLHVTYSRSIRTAHAAGRPGGVDLIAPWRRHQGSIRPSWSRRKARPPSGRQVFTDKGMPSTTPTWQPYFHTPEAGGKVAKDQHTQVPSISSAMPIRPRRAALHAFGTLQDRLSNWRYRNGRSRRASSQTPTCPQSPLRDPAQLEECPSNTPARSTTSSVAADRTVARDKYERRAIPATPAATSRPRSGSVSDGTLALFHGPRCYMCQRRAHRNPNPAGRVRRFDATGRRPVDKWTAAPRLTTSPQGQPQQQKRTYDVLRKPGQIHLLATAQSPSGPVGPHSTIRDHGRCMAHANALAVVMQCNSEWTPTCEMKMCARLYPARTMLCDARLCDARVTFQARATWACATRRRHRYRARPSPVPRCATLCRFIPLYPAKSHLQINLAHRANRGRRDAGRDRGEMSG